LKLGAIGSLIRSLGVILGQGVDRRVITDSWSTFLEGRAAERSGDPQQASKLYLEAAEAGLPVAEVYMWLRYRAGEGGLVDPVASTAWGLRAIAHGWPRVLLTSDADQAPVNPTSRYVQ